MNLKPGDHVTWVGLSHLFERPVTIVAGRRSLDGTHDVYDIHDAEVIKGVIFSIPASQLERHCRTCGFTHPADLEGCPRWETPLFESLTLAEWDQLCTRMERAMVRTAGGVRADCTAVHGDLMLTWHGIAELELRLAVND